MQGVLKFFGLLIFLLIVLYLIAVWKEGVGHTDGTASRSEAVAPIPPATIPPPTPDQAWLAAREQHIRRQAETERRQTVRYGTSGQATVSNIRNRLEAIARQTGVTIYSYDEWGHNITVGVQSSTHPPLGNFIEQVIKHGYARDFETSNMGAAAAGGRRVLQTTYSFEYSGP